MIRRGPIGGMVVGLSLGSVAGMVAYTVAGPLSPPAGSVAPSYKTLSEVEPRIAINAANTPGDSSVIYRITQPGSYYLTASVARQPGKGGIRIEADHVTVDLSGYTINGFGVGAGVFTTAPERRAIVIRNGTITGYSDGISLAVSSTTSIEDVIVTNVSRHGIVGNFVCRVSNCTVTAAPGDGILVDDGSSVSGCLVSSVGDAETDAGIRTDANCIVERSTVDIVVGDGIVLGQGSIARDNIASRGTHWGVVAAEGCLVERNMVRGNAVAGIRVVGASYVTANQTRVNGIGISVDGQYNHIVDNHCWSDTIGISTQGLFHFTARNTMAGMTSSAAYVSQFDNPRGPIVDVHPGGPLTSYSNGAHPQANFVQ